MRYETRQQVRLALRFGWVWALSLLAVALFMRIACDEPPHGPPGWLRGLVGFGVPSLIALVDGLITVRRLGRDDEK